MHKKTAIVILGGGLVKDNGIWRTTYLDEGTDLGALGDRLRVEAAYVLYSKNPEILLIPSGGKGMYKDIPDAPTVAEVMKRELLELGVPEKNIIKEEESSNTWQQLQKLEDLISTEGLSKVFILSNRYHMLRIQAMIEKDNALCALLGEGKIKAVSAEDVLIEHDPSIWKEQIDDAYQSKGMKQRTAMEEQGVCHIQSGTYKLK